ncbi:hypothetical protein SNE40_015866 [Patella caerulea]|uniref:Mutator-like transposase domain-containing protein n=1 Tax=Patella caerulea TaxID=87958 RepID=A0AAN8IZ03_PATCE
MTFHLPSTADPGNISDTNILLPSYDDMGSGSRRELRSKPKKTQDDVSNNMDTLEGNRIINTEKMVDMLKSVINLHFQLEEEACLMPNFEVTTKEKWEAGWKYSMRCTICKVIFLVYNLYVEVDTGKQGGNAAAIN